MKLKWVLVIISLLASSYAAAQDFKDITADEIKGMISAKENIFIVDARADSSYKQGHIPTSINITADKFSRIQEFLPKNKDAFLVFYCTGGKAG